jgi:hypothetical protein
MLTDKQEKFLELLFDDAYIGQERKAMIDAGYAESSHVSTIIQSLKKEILDRADTFLARKVAKSLHSVMNVMDNPEQKGAKARLESASMVLDRVGLSKKERMEIEHKIADGVIILPSKKTV